MSTTLADAQRVVDQLTLADRLRLLDYLTDHITDDQDAERDTGDPWASLFSTLDTIAAGPWVSERTASEELAAMRR